MNFTAKADKNPARIRQICALDGLAPGIWAGLVLYPGIAQDGRQV